MPDEMMPPVAAEAPSPSLLRSLFDAAEEFRLLQPWTWMDERDMMAVRDPDSGELMFITAMGNLGICRGLSVYLGAQGMAGYLKIMDLDDGEDGMKVMLDQRSLLFSFDDREELMPVEARRLANLGLSFRGKQRWPTFRSLVPGAVPFPINAEEGAAMLTALEQFLIVATGVRDGTTKTRLSEMLFPMLMRERSPATGAWTETVLESSEHVSEHIELLPEAVTMIEEATLSKPRSGAVWEMAFPWLQGTCIAGIGGRPFVPRAMLVVDRQSTFILCVEIISGENARLDLPDAFARFILEAPSLPKQVQVADRELYASLQGTAQAAHLDLVLVPRVPEAEKEAKDLVRSMAPKQGHAPKGRKR